MPSPDTKPYKMTIKSISEIERIRTIIAKELGIDVKNVKKKHAEIVFRLKAMRGKVLRSELKDVLAGVIK